MAGIASASKAAVKKEWQYGVGALGAVIHDSLILLSIFSIFWGELFPFSLEIEQKFIAAILTVIGYSINDTVIVFGIVTFIRLRVHCILLICVSDEIF